MLNVFRAAHWAHSARNKTNYRTVSDEWRNLMALLLEDKLAMIRESLMSDNFDVMEASGSFRAVTASGICVYIFPETHDNTITARYETRDPDGEKRQSEIDQLHRELSGAFDFAKMEPFEQAQSFDARFVYTTKVNFRVEEAAETPETDFVNDQAEAIRGESQAYEAVMAHMENMDARALREALDRTYLKRSSKVRIALNRIFREAISVEDLEAVVKNEARKIAAIKDRQELELVKSTNTDEQLQPLIDLLAVAVCGENP